MRAPAPVSIWRGRAKPLRNTPRTSRHTRCNFVSVNAVCFGGRRGGGNEAAAIAAAVRHAKVRHRVHRG